MSNKEIFRRGGYFVAAGFTFIAGTSLASSSSNYLTMKETEDPPARFKLQQSFVSLKNQLSILLRHTFIKHKFDPMCLRKKFIMNHICFCEGISDGSNLKMKKNFSSLDLLSNPQRFSSSHAIHGALRAPGLIERFNVYRAFKNNNMARSEGQALVIADIRFGSGVNGHTGIVHGGIISLMFDDLMGYGYGVAINDLDRIAYTAYLKINFKVPLRENTDVILVVSLEKIQGRKIYLKARMEDVHGTTVYSNAESLYVLARS